ncbi:DUF3459 domain-containing protein [Streptomyces sp. NPDC035033]|uniref:DUF3459 domain-containing protein n=1 Tax=Streptomyces sp. NPDC035033 TaxID=3155368 RepID=UPI0033E6542B
MLHHLDTRHPRDGRDDRPPREELLHLSGLGVDGVLVAPSAPPALFGQARLLGLKVVVDVTGLRVADEADPVLRGWLDRGADGIRVDLPSALPGHPVPWHRWRTWCESLTARDGRPRLLMGNASFGSLVASSGSTRSAAARPMSLLRPLTASWHAPALRRIIDEAFHESTATGSTVTWAVNRPGITRSAPRYDATGVPVSGRDRMRAATLLALALPGAACLRRDALPRPPRQRSASPHPPTHPRRAPGAPGSLRRGALALRRRLPQLGEGPMRGLDTPPEVLAFVRGEGLVCAVNFGDAPRPAPMPGPPHLASRLCPPGLLPPHTAAWWITDAPPS